MEAKLGPRSFIWEYWDQIKEADEIRESFQKRLGEDRELTKLQQSILVQLGSVSERTVTTVAHALKMDPGNFSKACTTLEKKGYIQRTRSEADSRKVFLDYTDKGLAYVNQFESFVDNTFSDLDKEISELDGEDLVESLRSCNKSLKQILEGMDRRTKRSHLGQGA